MITLLLTSTGIDVMDEIVKILPRPLNKLKLAHIITAANHKKDKKYLANETTKAVERGKAKIIFIAEDVAPQELVMHLPLLCEEKKIPYSYISTKKELGEKTGINVGTASIALIEEGNAKKELEEVIKKVSELKKV